MEKVQSPEHNEKEAAFKAIQSVLREFRIDGAILWDHTPVLRIQIPEDMFAHALQARETLVECIKPFGYRFISLDLYEL